MKIIYIIIYLFISISHSFAQYNLNIKFRVIEKFDKIKSSDNKEYIFYVDANYIFSDEGKIIYSNNMNNIQKELNNLEKKEVKNEDEKILLNKNIRMYKVLLNYSTPPKNFISLLINRQIYKYISKYPSSYIDNMMQNDLQKFYDDIRNNIIKNEIYTGKFTSLKFITKEKFRYYTGRT